MNWMLLIFLTSLISKAKKTTLECRLRKAILKFDAKQKFIDLAAPLSCYPWDTRHISENQSHPTSARKQRQIVCTCFGKWRHTTICFEICCKNLGLVWLWSHCPTKKSIQHQSENYRWTNCNFFWTTCIASLWYFWSYKPIIEKIKQIENKSTHNVIRPRPVKTMFSSVRPATCHIISKNLEENSFFISQSTFEKKIKEKVFFKIAAN